MRPIHGLCILGMAITPAVGAIAVTASANAVSMATKIFGASSANLTIVSAMLSFNDLGLGPSSGEFSAALPNN